jgi:hypothetical protein
MEKSVFVVVGALRGGGCDDDAGVVVDVEGALVGFEDCACGRGIISGGCAQILALVWVLIFER